MSIYHCYNNTLPEGVDTPAQLMALVSDKNVVNVGNTFYYVDGLRGSWCAEIPLVGNEIEAHHELAYTSCLQRSVTTSEAYAQHVWLILQNYSRDKLLKLHDSAFLCRCRLRKFCPSSVVRQVVEFLLDEIM